MIKGIMLSGATALNPFSNMNLLEKNQLSQDGILARIVRDADETIGGLVWYYRGNDWVRVANYHPGSLNLGQPLVTNLHRWIRAYHVPESAERFIHFIADDDEAGGRDMLKRLLYRKAVIRSVMARIGDPSKFIASVASSHWRDE